jgi:MFS family permease
LTGQPAAAIGLKKGRVFYGYIVIAAGILASIFLVGISTSFSIFFKPLSGDFGWSRATTAVASSILHTAMGISALVMGRLTDKYGPRVVIIGAGMLMGVGNLLMSHTNSLWQLYLFYGVLVGAGAGASDVPIVSTVARWFVRKRGMMVGVAKAGAGIGIMFLPLLSNWLISGYGWRNAYTVIGILAAALIIGAGFFFKRDPSEMGELPDGGTKTESVKTTSGAREFSLSEAMKTRQFWTFSVMFFLFMYCVQVVLVHMANHITDLNISATIAAMVISVVGGVSIFGRLGLAGLSDVIGPKSSYVISFVLLTAAFILVQFAKVPWMFYLFAVIYGLAHGGCLALLSPMTAHLFGTRYLGSVLGVVFFAGTMGGLFSPVISGRIFDVTGSYQIAFLICTALGIIGLALTLSLKPIGKEEKNEA